MPRPQSWKKLPGPSRLSGILAHLRKAPRLHLDSTVRSLKLTLAQRNDHWSARHFMREDLPRIRYANPDLEILVDKKPKTSSETFPSEVVLEFDNGRIESFNVDNMWSTDILTRILDLGGGSFWPSWKAARIQQGLPVLDRPEPRAPTKTSRPNLFRRRTGQKVDDTPSPAEVVVDMSKTGAARILP